MNIDSVGTGVAERGETYHPGDDKTLFAAEEAHTQFLRDLEERDRIDIAICYCSVHFLFPGCWKAIDDYPGYDYPGDREAESECRIRPDQTVLRERLFTPILEVEEDTIVSGSKASFWLEEPDGSLYYRPGVTVLYFWYAPSLRDDSEVSTYSGVRLDA